MKEDRTQRIIEAYRRVFNSVEGTLVLEDMANAHHFNSSILSKCGRPIDPFLLAEAEGERNVILRIKTILEETRNV